MLGMDNLGASAQGKIKFCLGFGTGTVKQTVNKYFLGGTKRKITS